MAAARFTQKRKEASHERILDAASRAIRRSGYSGTGVADIMKEAGLTHGGFYAHFDSREAMLAEAAGKAAGETVAMLGQIATSAPGKDAFRAVVNAYLSAAHLERCETGCPVAALGSEMPRQAQEVRGAATRGIKSMIDLVGRCLPIGDKSNAQERAMAATATMVGALILARAVDDPSLSRQLLGAARRHLTGD